MRIVDDLIADPSEFTDGRTELDLSGEGLEVSAVDWGEAAIDAVMVARHLGEEPVDRKALNKEATLSLKVRKGSTLDLPTVADKLQKKVGEWQEAGGWLRRDFHFAEGGEFAGSLACQVKRASLSNFAGWQAGDSPDVTLSLLLGPYWYETEGFESTVVEETSAREAQFTLEDLEGSAPGLIEVRIDNDNASGDWRAVRAAIECRDHPQDETADTTAALAYECEDLTPKGGAASAALAGASGGTVVQHTALTAGWLAILDSKIAGVGHMTHRGTRRVWLRAYDPGATAGLVELRLEWRALGSLIWTPNEAVATPLVEGFCELDLGEARPQQAALGDERWEWRIMARALSGSGAIRLDRVRIEPTEQRIVVRAPGTTQNADLQSQKSAGSAEDKSGVGTIAWSNPTNVTSSNNTYATASVTSSATTHYLLSKSHGFALPEGATVLGIVAEVERSAPEAETKLNISDSAVRLAKAGVVGGDSKAKPGLWEETEATVAYGGSADLWGQTWTPSEINASGFGVALSAKGTAGETGVARIDFVRITVYYTEADDENRVCFAERSMEFRSNGVYRQHTTDDVWGRLVPEDGFFFELPAGGLGGRTMRGLIVPSRGDLDTIADSETNKLSVQVFAKRGYLFAREAA